MADCKFYDPVCQVKGAATGAVSSVAGSALDQLADGVSNAVGKVVSSLGTFWVHVDTPNLTTGGGGDPSDTVAFLQSHVFWYTAAIAVVSVLVAAGRLAYEARLDGGKDLMRSLVTLIAVTAAGVPTIALFVQAMDGFAVWIIDESVQGSDFGKNLTSMMAVGSLNPLGAVLTIVVGLIAVLASLVQIMLMVVRGAMLVLLVGILPLAGAATNTATGRAWFQRCVAWLIAFALYKPAAAIVYATAFRLTGAQVSGADDLVTVLTGLVMMVLALFALPALLRFCVPVVGAVSSGGGGGLGAAVAGALPSGAVMVGQMRGGQLGAPPARLSGPSGAGSTAAPSGAAAMTGAGGAAGAAASAAQAAHRGVNGVAKGATGQGEQRGWK